jgi:hypothetical protein
MLAKTQKPTPAEIAAGVAKSTKHIEVEQQLAALRAHYEERRAHQLRLIHADRHNHGGEINSLQAELDRLNGEMGPIRAELAECREVHGAAIAKKLAPLRRELASQLVDLAVEMRAVRGVFDESQVAIERAGGTAPRMPPVGLAEIERLARRLAGKD